MCRDNKVGGNGCKEVQGNDIMSIKTQHMHIRRITGFKTESLSGDVGDQEGAATPIPRGEEPVAVVDHNVDHFHSPFSNNNIGEVFDQETRPKYSQMKGQHHPSGEVTVARRRASTSLLSEDLERASSRLKIEGHGKSTFEAQMSKLKCLSIRKDEEHDDTPDGGISRTLSCRGMPGEVRVQIQKHQRSIFEVHNERKKSPDSFGSSGSEAMPIPHISRACTAPDQLPELSSSMLESLLMERDKEEKKNKSPKGASLSTPNGQERRINATGRRVPSAAFLDDLAALQERQYSVFRSDSDKRISTRHYLYST